MRALAALVLVALSFCAAPAYADTGVGTVTGAISNGTSGASVPDGLRVTLRAYVQNRLGASWTAPVDANKRFQFSNIPTDPQTS